MATKTLYVAASALNLREGPQLTAPKVGKLNKGDKVSATWEATAPGRTFDGGWAQFNSPLGEGGKATAKGALVWVYLPAHKAWAAVRNKGKELLTTAPPSSGTPPAGPGSANSGDKDPKDGPPPPAQTVKKGGGLALGLAALAFWLIYNS